ncbi:hypothetical protein J6590_053764 [Homalodisca vitripennis]|nr:hypothetical protein J6590_053764 [Homalodisca vitripennis]
MRKGTESGQKRRNEFVSWLQFYLRIAGLWQISPLVDGPRILYHVIAMGLACAGGWLLFAQKYDDFSINTDVLLHAVLVAHSLMVYLVYLRKRGTICRIAKTMEDRFSEYSYILSLDRYRRVWDRSDRLSLILMKFGSISCIALYTFYIYNSNMFSPERKLIYPIWVPFSVEYDLNYFLTVCLQLTIFSLYSFIHVSGCGICIGGSHFIGASFDVIGLAFRDLCKTKGLPRGDEEKPSRHLTLEALQLEKLKSCVDAHVAILSVIKDYKSVFEGILLEVLISCEIIICFAGFQVVLAVEKRDYQKAILLSCMALLLVFHLFMFCYPGQHIYNKSEQLRETLYLSQWEDQSLQFQKCLGFMLMGTLKPVTVSCRGIMDASMSSFLHALRTAFSYVNILLILRGVR